MENSQVDGYNAIEIVFTVGGNPIEYCIQCNTCNSIAQLKINNILYLECVLCVFYARIVKKMTLFQKQHSNQRYETANNKDTSS